MLTQTFIKALLSLGSIMADKAPPKKEKPKKGIWQNYTVKGDSLERKNLWSPKKGPGYFMAKHKDRQTCGATGYTEFKTKESSESKGDE